MRNEQEQKITQHTFANCPKFLTVDTRTASAACFSLSVRAGHFFDPDDNEGLAHLLEHMLFLGSRQQPAPNQIIQFVQSHGGSVNAWTAGEFANFHFSCAPDALATVIPAFLETLFHPLLAEAMISSEIQSIDAEFNYKKKDELRRLYQIHKETCNPAHPFSKFSVGNAELFGRHSVSSMRQQLRSFHQRYYHKHNIHIAMSSPRITDKDVNTVRRALERLPDGHVEKCDWPELYRRKDLAVQINVKPLQKSRRLIVTFAIMAQIKPLQSALSYISHVLGDESEGSLLAYLRSQGWATNLIAGNGIEGSDFKDFNVNIQLTADGEKEIESILNGLFYNLSLIETHDAPWRRQEKADLDRLAREYSESPLSLDTVCDLAESLFVGVPEFDNAPCSEDSLLQALAWMTPQRLRIKFISPDANTSSKSKYYNAEYSVEALGEQLLETCARPTPIDAIALPTPNPFVITAPVCNLRKPQWSTPHALTTDSPAKVWFSQEQQFGSVKGDLYCSFDIHDFASSPTQNLIKRMWLYAVNERLQAELYRANISGLHYRLYGHQCGFTMHCRGFTQALLPLASKVIESTFDHPFCQHSFEQAKAMQQRNLANSLVNKPINRLFANLGVLVQRYSYAPHSLLKALPELTAETYCKVTQGALSNMFCESFMHGNWTYDDAMQWQDQLKHYNQRFISSPLSRDVVRLPQGDSLIQRVDCDHDDAAVVLYLQAPHAGPEQTAFCMVIEQLLAGPFFNALRTEQQLGYVVGTGFVPHNQHPGMVFYIQSPSHDVNQLLQAMIRFLKEQIHDLVFYQNYWPTIQKNLLKQITEPDINLAMQSQRYWLNIGLGDIHNKRQGELAKAIQNLSFDDLVKEGEALLSRHSYGELILYAPGKFDDLSEDVGTFITNLDNFKATATFFP